MADLQGRVAFITGAKGGLGTSVTHTFLKAGARVIGVSRSIKPGDFEQPDFTALPAALSSGNAPEAAAASALAQCPGIDSLIHVMGGFAGGQSVADTDDATLEKMLDLNFKSAFYILRAVIPHMRAQGGGRIVAVASRQGVEPSAMLSAYNASKA